MMTPHSILAVALCSLVLLPSCQSTSLGQRRADRNAGTGLKLPPLPKIGEIPQKGEMYEWWGDGLKGPGSLRIDLTKQKAYILINGEDAGWTFIASGKYGHATPTGTFRVTEKSYEKNSNRFGAMVDEAGKVVVYDGEMGVDPIPPGGKFVGATMPYWMRLTDDGIGLHSGPIPHPGYPASHGCIRLPPVMAEKIYSLVGMGATVTIKGKAPMD